MLLEQWAEGDVIIGATLYVVYSYQNRNKHKQEKRSTKSKKNKSPANAYPTIKNEAQQCKHDN